MIQRKTGTWKTAAALQPEGPFNKAKEGVLEVGFYLALFLLVLGTILVLCVFLLCALIQDGYSRIRYGHAAKNDWFDSGLE